MHCITTPPTPTHSQTHNLVVHQVPAHHDNVIWLIEYSPGLCAVVDGPSAIEVLAYIESNNLRISHILNTHTHGDHVGINRDLAKRNLIDGIEVVGCRTRATDIPHITMGVDEGDTFQLGDVEVNVWRTEGHIDGHLSFIVADFVFCGDTMFSGGCGYLFDGPPAKMHASLQRLASLPPETFVCPAHEYTEDNLLFAMSVESSNPKLVERFDQVKAIRSRGESTLPSTVQIERDSNPFVRVDSAEIQQNVSASEGVEVFAKTRALKDSKAYRRG